jgi:hypothetical protein
VPALAIVLSITPPPAGWLLMSMLSEGSLPPAYSTRTPQAPAPLVVILYLTASPATGLAGTAVRPVMVPTAWAVPHTVMKEARQSAYFVKEVFMEVFMEKFPGKK